MTISAQALHRSIWTRSDLAAPRANREGNAPGSYAGKQSRAERDRLLAEWPRVIAEAYPTTEHAAADLGVEASTARRWAHPDLNRRTLPSAATLVRACQIIPGARERLL